MSVQNKDTWIQYKILAVGISNILKTIYIGLGVLIQIVNIKTDENNINIIDTEKISVEKVP